MNKGTAVRQDVSRHPEDDERVINCCLISQEANSHKGTISARHAKRGNRFVRSVEMSRDSKIRIKGDPWPDYFRL